MRIARLDLKAFGPFTDLSLDFSGGAPGGLHVIYGPNEAGKSSALRAVRDLLYGFEHRTRDAHLHASEDLCIGGLLEGPEGSVYVQRVKRRKASLLDADGNPFDEARLRKLLGGVERETFARSFGLGHAELEAQGERLLRGESSVGETLFDAGAGGVDVRRMLEALRAEQEKLYLARGKQQEINRLVEECRAARQRSQEVWLLPETFQKQAEELEAARAELTRAGEQLARLRAEQHRLTGLKNLLPTIERRAECLRELAALGSVVVVSEAATERRERAEAGAAAARAAIERLEQESERSARRLGELEVPEALLAIGQHRVARLADAPGRTRKAREDLPRLEARRRALESQARERLGALGRAESPLRRDAFRLSSADRARIRALKTEHERLDVRLAALRERRSTLKRELDERRAALARLPEPEGVEALERVALLARTLGDVEAPVLALERRRAELLGQAERKLRALNPPLAGLEALEALVVPSTETLTRLAEEGEALARRGSLLEGERDRLALAAAETAAAIRRIEASGDVPNERDAAAARSERQSALTVVVDAWGARAPFDAEAVTRLGERIERADSLSDRLRREAGRVAELSHARSEAELVAERSVNLEARAAAQKEAEAAHAAACADAWRGAPFSPLPPAEMLGWLERRARVLELGAEARSLEPELTRAKTERARLAAALETAVGPLSVHDTLALGVERALARATERARLARQREELLTADDALAAELEHAGRELETAEAACAAWQAAWGAAVRVLGVEPNVPPEAAVVLVEEITELSSELASIEELAGRIDGIRRDEAALAAEVGELSRVHGVGFDPQAPDAAAEEIVARFRRGEAARTERARLEAEAAERQTLLAGARSNLGDAERELAELGRAAGATRPEELPLLEAKSRRARELERRLEDLEVTLVDGSGGRPVSSLVAEAEGKEAPELLARLDELAREIDELEEERARAIDRAASLQAGQRRQSDADGAEAAQEEQTLGAALGARVERYATLRVATALLERAIERYRVENQGPILKRAGELFPRLTGDRYTSLRVAREGQKIVAVRPDGSELSPDQLSEGTRYQLYLALRLASVERFIAGAEPLPLILDDATIHFDEARKARTFAVLAELAERVQILFFTHHERDAELALESGAATAPATESRAATVPATESPAPERPPAMRTFAHTLARCAPRRDGARLDVLH